jgi:putative sporulation protein YtxC
LNLDSVYLSQNKFKHYNNIIIHYIGNDASNFFYSLSDTLSTAILEFYEDKLVKRIINSNYFYFTDIEKKNILDTCINVLKNEDYVNFEDRQTSIFSSINSYISENKCILLDGFVNFRLNDYLKTIDSTVDYSVNKFLIEREYNEFIDLLKLYITSKKPTIDKVHLIYQNHESILVNSQNNIIDINNSDFNAKYLSDISFSTNDYVLNALLTLLPEKICIHLIDEDDEFINTLKLIFDKRVIICRDCNICKTYRLTNLKKVKK